MRNRNKFVILCPFLLIFLAWQVHSADQNDAIDDIEYAIREGNVQKLLSHLNPFIDITIDGNTKTYDKAQAEAVLQQFFNQHVISSFSFVHKRKSKKGTQYAIGRYQSRDADYSVLVKIRRTKAAPLIYMISFIAE